MYRVNRHDVPAEPPLNLEVDERLAFCREHVLRMNGRPGSLNTATGGCHAIYDPASALGNNWLTPEPHPSVRRTLLHTNACGDFTLLHRDVWFALRGYPEWPMYSMHLDSVPRRTTGGHASWFSMSRCGSTTSRACVGLRMEPGRR